MKSRIDANFMREHFIEHELKPALNKVTSLEYIEIYREKYPDEKYLHINVEYILKQCEEQGSIEIKGSPEDWFTFRVIYKDTEIPYSTFWHSVQTAVLEHGFEHVGNAIYRLDLSLRTAAESEEKIRES